MRFEIIVILITGLIMANVYTEGKYIKVILSWKKYYQMIGIALIGYSVCWLFRKNPNRAKEILNNSNEYLKYMPIDKGTSSILSPLLDFTSKHEFLAGTGAGIGVGAIGRPQYQDINNQYEERIIKSGTNKATKRSVSETKKKFVAARQNWMCGDCRKQLPAWFEVDHTIRLENGGSNHIDNLVALCRDCHGKKTAIENL